MHFRLSSLHTSSYKQIDNQLDSTPFPVVMVAHKPFEVKELLHLSVVKSNLYSDVDYYQYFSILVQELDINIDETFLGHLLKFINTNVASYYSEIEPVKRDNNAE